ncbi:MAG: hypothetical protein LUG62_09875 [Clostridiales bacterium]|nr:hypothetical protein [Clostridiales bacterium]
MKWTLFHKKEKQKLYKTQSYPEYVETDQTESAKPDDDVPGIKEGYFVDRFYSYGEPVDFINEKLDIQKPIIRNHEFMDFPGVDETVEEGRKYNRYSNSSYADWMKYVERKPVSGRFHYRVEFSRPNEQGETRVLWMLQPHDTPDDDGFGMGNTPEIMLSAYLDKKGDYLGPFRLERISW